MPHFTYTKDNGEVSKRNVIPIGFNFGDRDKVLCIDITDATPSEIKELEDWRAAFIDNLKEFGFGNRFRQFFLDGINEVSE